MLEPQFLDSTHMHHVVMSIYYMRICNYAIKLKHAQKGLVFSDTCMLYFGGVAYLEI